MFKTTHQAMRYFREQRKLLHLKELRLECIQVSQKTFNIKPCNLTHKTNYKIDDPIKTTNLYHLTKIHELILEFLIKGDANLDSVEEYIKMWKPMNRLDPYKDGHVKYCVNWLVEFGFISQYYVILKGRPFRRLFYYIL